ncbi:Molybdenum cofactor biosynthesis protein 1 [Hypsizygus marmoreus]|uniref:Molybdenum cofactor biosynthesis protein 1 n=1 Tax=Hypsizygus marmoreus TaxID=39966 RepID=A0A369K7G3_HYPMA|nr:Molybdenum cofactor biosynthesis protein 1 [Hypsizygus marmoreus]
MTYRISRSSFLRSSCRFFSTETTLAPSLRSRAKAKLAEIDSSTPFSPALVDTFGRKHDYLRISLTERCNLRCFYCMPSEGVELSPDGSLLTNDEVIRLAALFVKSGVTKIRLTGGEPTVRKGIAEIISSLNGLRQFGLRSIAMTSNGLALHRRLPQLIENGLSHLNLSLDTLDPFKFELITRRRGHDAVLKALDVALNSSLQSVKLNVVIVKGLNDAEISEFVEMTKDHPLSVRFIEFMPFTGNKWDKKKMVPSAELLGRLTDQYPDVYRAPDELNDTARSWKIPGYRGNFGFISSMSDHFCSSCNRLRITADGQIKVCLFDAKELSLRDELRRGASDDELLDIIGRAVSGKQEKHAGMEDIDVVTNRPMILIGGYPSFRPYMTPKPRNTFWPPFPLPQPLSIRISHPFSTSAPSHSAPSLTHIDEHGRASMVDVGDKAPTKRTATAVGRIYIPQIAYDLVTSTHRVDDAHPEPKSHEEQATLKARRKGDALTVAQLAAIMGAKKTSDLIPLCHPLSLTKIAVTLTPESPNESNEGPVPGRYSIICRATVSTQGKTGVEMEALTAVSVGLLTVWDMLKAIAGREMEIGGIMVSQKSGGRSGDFQRGTLA